MSADYWLGVATIPALLLTGSAVSAVLFRAAGALHRRGFSVEAKRGRNYDKISDYVLRNHIWWERQFGPIFVGGWYREEPKYQQPSRRRLNRWIGLGRAEGACVMFFRTWDLGDADD